MWFCGPVARALEIRPATDRDAEALGLITVSASLATFLGEIPEADLDFGWTPTASASGWREVLARLDRAGDEFVSVAEIDGSVVGFVWAGASTGRADYVRAVSGLYVIPSMQRRGVGRALLDHVADRMAEVGIDTLLIGCVKDNPSCDFYRRLGGVEVFRQPQWVDRFETEEIFFGWRTLRDLQYGSGRDLSA